MIISNKHPWWQSAVIYQIYPRSYKDSDGDGIGDLSGIIQQLDYLSGTLGVDVLWLSPFYPSPMADFGYDVSDYMDVAPVFGNLETFGELVYLAHQKGLKIIIDFVPNHSSNQHPWFIESSASKINPKRDWYVWADAKGDGSPPNNWLSVFGGSAWEWHPSTEQYYLHSFLKEQPDLNWRNPLVKKAMFDVLRFWLDKGVDGFRIDVAHFIMKDPEMRDNPLETAAERALHRPLGEYDSQIHLHDQGHPDVHTIYQELRQLLEEYGSISPRVSIGEIHIFDWETWASFYGSDLDELHMPFNFQLLNVKWKAEDVMAVVETLENILPPGAWPNYVLGNHDEPRLATRLGVQGARLAAVLLLTLRGTPTLYYGDEIGMTEVEIPPAQQQDPWGRRVPGLGRDGCRTPMQWDASSLAGFSLPGTQGCWLPFMENFQQVNVEKQLQQPDSLLNLYRQLLAFRKKTPPLQIGDYFTLPDLPEGCFGYRRRWPGYSEILVVLNFSSQLVNINLDNYSNGKLILSTYLDRDEKVNLDGLQLRSNEGVIIQLAKED
jgi:alpha-glucosidase